MLGARCPVHALFEDLVDQLRERYTIVIVTHNMQQAARIAQRTAFFHLGELREVDDTEQCSSGREPSAARILSPDATASPAISPSSVMSPS